MALWSVRRPLYKAGVLVQHLGFLIFVVGFATPFWFHASPGEGSQGLWHYCNGQCHKLQVEEEWFEAVRAVLCLTLILYLMACVLAVYGNCLKKYDPLTYKHSRRIEITTAAAGVMGTVCMVVYTIMMNLHYQEYSKHYFGSAYGITMGGCLLALIAAVLLGATARPMQQHFVTVTTPVRQPYSVTYQSTSQHASAPPQFPGFANAATAAPGWNPSNPPPYKAPSYMPLPVAGCSYGFPTEFSNTAYPSTSAAECFQAAHSPNRGVSAGPPPYHFQPSAPAAPSAFLE